MRSLIMIVLAFAATQARAKIRTLDLPSYPSDNSGVQLVISATALGDDEVMIAISAVNNTKKSLTMLPNSMPFSGKWWSPWISISQTEIPAGQVVAPRFGYPDEWRMGCVEPDPFSPSPAKTIAPGARVEIFQQVFSVSKNRDVIFQGVYFTSNEEPLCASARKQWKGASRLGQIRSNFIVVTNRPV